MTTYFVSSVDGDDGSAGTDWDLAKATITGALAVATTAGDVIKISHIHQEVLGADTTYTAGAHVNLIVVNRASSDALAVMDGSNGYIGHTSTSYAVTFSGAYKQYWRGAYFLGSGSTAKNYNMVGTDGAHQRFEQSTFKFTTGAGSLINVGISGTSANGYLELRDCTIVLTNTGQRWLTLLNSRVRLVGVVTSGTARFCTLGARSGYLYAEACDLSSCSNADMFVDNANSGFEATLVNCKLPTGVSVLAAQTTHPNLSSSEIFIYNCDDGDEHFRIAHYNALGETTVDIANYISADGAAYDGTNRCSWKIVTSANATFYTPYVSPWIDAYKAAADGLTLSLEGLFASETDSAADTVAQNDEIWGEFSTQATTGFTTATIDGTDRMLPLGSAADQTSAKATTDWTISTSNDAYKTTFKLESASINQKEIGHVRARVCVGIASKTFFVDPQIRGLT